MGGIFPGKDRGGRRTCLSSILYGVGGWCGLLDFAALRLILSGRVKWLSAVLFGCDTVFIRGEVDLVSYLVGTGFLSICSCLRIKSK